MIIWHIYLKYIEVKTYGLRQNYTISIQKACIRGSFGSASEDTGRKGHRARSTTAQVLYAQAKEKERSTLYEHNEQALPNYRFKIVN